MRRPSFSYSWCHSTGLSGPITGVGEIRVVENDGCCAGGADAEACVAFDLQQVCFLLKAGKEGKWCQ